jgi:hypothetical protein
LTLFKAFAVLSKAGLACDVCLCHSATDNRQNRIWSFSSELVRDQLIEPACSDRIIFESVGVVAVLVVVKVSKTYADRDSLVDNGVEDLANRAESKWERIVVFPEPDSPKKTTA